MKKEYTWELKADTEIWGNDIFNSEAECIADAIENGVNSGETIAIGEVEHYIVPSVDVSRIFENMMEEAYNECGEVSESWEPCDDTRFKKELDGLEEDINDLIIKYLKQTNNMPGFYSIRNIYTVEIPKE